MTQKELALLVKLLCKWAKFIESGRHELPDAKSDAEARQASEPMAGELCQLVARQVQRWIN